MYHPITEENEDEYIELYNRSAEPVDISGWAFSDGVDFEFPADTVIGPGAYLVVAKDPARLIAAHPGCTERDMRRLKRFASRRLRINPEQVQIFTPTPSTYSSLMYYTEMDPWTREEIFVEKEPAKRERQKAIVVEKRK